MPEQVQDLVIIGGGIIGAATALEAQRRFPRLRLLVLEKETEVAAHQSGHNSGVIHSGLYYPPGSLKAAMCVEGAEAMLRFCRVRGVPHEVCGKVVVATSEQELPALEELGRRGAANGVPGLRLIGPGELREIEPASAGIRALHVPRTAITDFAQVTRIIAGLVQQQGGEVRTGCRVVGVSRRHDEVVVKTSTGEVAARQVVNCAGLHADRICRMAGAEPDLRIVPFRGEYYELAPERHGLVKGLIYPVPDARFPFLGVHFTRRIQGGVEAGPNAVLALKREGYRHRDVSLRDTAETLAYSGFLRMAMRYWKSGLAEWYRSLSKRAFAKALQKLVPQVRESDLHRGGSGVRAQAVDRQGNLVNDFRIVEDGRMIHVLNVPSPAATASLVIGRHIAGLLDARLSS